MSTIPVQPKEKKKFCSLVEIQILQAKITWCCLRICFSWMRITYLQLPFSVKLIEFVHSVYISYFYGKRLHSWCLIPDLCAVLFRLTVLWWSMGCFEEVTQEGPGTNQHNDERSICLHAFSDLSHVPPATFICLLKDCYVYGRLTNKLHVS